MILFLHLTYLVAMASLSHYLALLSPFSHARDSVPLRTFDALARPSMRALCVVVQSRVSRLLESLLSHSGAVVFAVCPEYKCYFRRVQRMSDNDDIEVDSDVRHLALHELFNGFDY